MLLLTSRTSFANFDVPNAAFLSGDKGWIWAGSGSEGACLGRLAFVAT